jgi:hypothetical protein
MRIRDPKTTALIFASGKMVVTGAKSEDDSRLASRKYARIIQKLGFDAKFAEFKIQNIVGSCDVKFPIRLEGLAFSHGAFSSYEPEVSASRGEAVAEAGRGQVAKWLGKREMWRESSTSHWKSSERWAASDGGEMFPGGVFPGGQMPMTSPGLDLSPERRDTRLAQALRVRQAEGDCRLTQSASR